jgi:YidC/Oxa1 family membrane protein insertase
VFRNGEVERLAPGTFKDQPSLEGTFRYAGVDDHYFLAAALPGEQPIRIAYEPVSLPAAGPPNTTTRDFVSFTVRPSKTPLSVRFFLGPKDFDVLFGVQQELVQVINFGIFSFLAVPLLRALKGINVYAGNYGWSIVILTVLINALMFPLRHKSVVSMRKLQQLQPEIKAIQDRYSKLKATDPAKQKMNAEMMNLYKERGVNPASGCIPMLLTIPVLFALYSLLSQAIEIRGAPFIFWIKDLSVYDPYYVTPILMGVTMVIQQKMTPSTADPMQQKMMMFMPVIFTFMFLWYPSGLALYWFVGNLMAIGQQWATNKIIGPPDVRTIRPPAERRLKRVGGGTTEAAAGGAE